MKILIVNQDIGYGGAEKMLVFVANALSDAGNEVVFYTFRNDCVYQRLSPKVIHTHFGTEEKTGFISSLKTIWSLHKFIKHGCFDVSVAFLSPAQLRLSLASIFARTKILFSHRADPYQKSQMKGLKYKVAGLLNSLTFRNADYYVFQTDMARDYYPEAIRKRSVVICNPINPLLRTEERSVGKIKKTIVNVARHEIKQKRQDVLIEAFNMFNQLHSDYVLELYGDGEDTEIVQRLAKSNSNITVGGATKQVAEKIQNAAMFVLTSDYEGIPNALLEAMSLGVPCISTDCSPGGASMLIDSSEKGIVVNCGDVDALANAMAYMADNVEKAERMGQNGMYVNDEYSSIVIAKKWNELMLNIKNDENQKH